MASENLQILQVTCISLMGSKDRRRVVITKWLPVSCAGPLYLFWQYFVWCLKKIYDSRNVVIIHKLSPLEPVCMSFPFPPRAMANDHRIWYTNHWQSGGISQTQPSKTVHCRTFCEMINANCYRHNRLLWNLFRWLWAGSKSVCTLLPGIDK